MLNVAYIGFGNSVCRYHLPYVERRDNIRVKSIYRREVDRIGDTERESYYPSIKFTSNIDDILKDDEIKLIVVNTPNDSHVYYAKLALENNKHVLVEKPFAPTIEEAKEVLDLAKSKGLIAMTNHNRRYDADFLTVKKVIDSGVLGEILEIESHYDYYRPSMNYKGFGMIYGLGVHTIDQIISLLGTPDRINYDVRSLFHPGEADDYMDLDFFYGKMKAIIKTSFVVKTDYPRFIVHGTKGSFIKAAMGHQSSIKDGPGPVQIPFEVEPEENWGKLSYIDDEGIEHNEAVQTEIGDYGIIYDRLYESIFNSKEKPVTDEEIFTVTKILEEATKASKNL